MVRIGLALAVLMAGSFLARSHADEAVGLRAPEGFRVELYADDDLAHDIYSLTVDARGRVVVAGAGYVKILHDDNGDGRADRATLFAEIPRSGAHGLCFDGDDLICTGDNAVLRLRDANGDGVADDRGEVLTNLRHPEHGANGIVHGPDGWYYIICGNDAAVTARHASIPSSPVLAPDCGAVVRLAPDGRRSEVVAHGFRNPYDLAFNSAGHLFTYDADGERDQYLPWYTPTRIFDIAPGMHHGWVLTGWTRSWNRPEWFFDNVARLADVGRGSPTGVTVYRHRQFPARYRDALFACCWTMGRVYCFPLERSGSTYATETEIFLETTGDVGFAPVGVAVGPRGEMYVAIGGRRTRGGVFRVTYEGDDDDDSATNPVEEPDLATLLAAPDGEKLDAILQAPQPLAAWSRARWKPLAQRVGEELLEAAAADPFRSQSERIRAVEVLVEVYGGLTVDTAEQVLGAAAEGHADLAARVAWALGRASQGVEGARLVARLTHDRRPVVARFAWESLAVLREIEAAAPEANWRAIADRGDRRVRAAALLADARRHEAIAEELLPDDSSSAARAARLWRRHFHGRLAADDFPAAAEAFLSSSDPAVRLEAVRLMQLAAGDVRIAPQPLDVYHGYTPRHPEWIQPWWREQIGPLLVGEFPTRHAELDRELSRLIGMLEFDGDLLLERLTSRAHPGSRVEDDIHYLAVISRAAAARTERDSERIARIVARLHDKLEAGRMFVSRHWPDRVGEIFDTLLARDPHLPAALLAQSEFGRPEHSLFARRLPAGDDRLAAARRIAARAAELDDDFGWDAGLVRLIATLPDDEALPLLRLRWDDFTVRDDIALVLAERRQAEDRGRLVAALESAQPHVVESAAEGLAQLRGLAEPAELAAVLRALRQYCAAPPQKAVRTALAQLLVAWSGQDIDVLENGGDLLTVYNPWFEWFALAHPGAAATLAAGSTADGPEWRARLAAIDWDAGDAARGKAVYERRACHRCHSGSDRLGPDLVGAAQRLSRDDLFAEIVDPYRNVSPLYQTMQVVTRGGKVVHGLIVYQSPESTLVQTTPDTTVRVAGDEIVALQPSRISLMPQGLLDGLSDADLADLYAHLKQLGGRK